MPTVDEAHWAKVRASVRRELRGKNTKGINAVVAKKRSKKTKTKSRPKSGSGNS